MSSDVIKGNEATLGYLGKLEAAKFWGALTLKFEAGRIVHIRKEETLKPIELSEQPRKDDASESGSIQ